MLENTPLYNIFYPKLFDGLIYSILNGVENQHLLKINNTPYF